MENIHQVLYAIINLHIKSEAAGTLPPAKMDHVGTFMGTLHKIYIYIEAQQDRNKFKQLFRNNAMNNLLKDCRAGLDQALNIFEIDTSVRMLWDIGQMKKLFETTHKELLELISTLSETNTTSDKLSVYLDTNESKNSSNSFSLLPSKPKIFCGRETELEDIMRMLSWQAPRIAILGGGGMGKTSLARAVLHHSETLTRFEQRFFVSAEPSTTSAELAALIGLHVGLDPGQDPTKLVVQYFSGRPSCLLILDNLETVWEPVQSRGGVEEFLSLLTEVQHLGLIITMRGAERPAKAQWTHPFLLPLQPLSDDATQQMFMDITDNSYAIEDLTKFLSFTGNMPLAVDLTAHLVEYEGPENVLARWKTEKTSMLSVGYDRKSNLGISISLSLSSPRITSDSKELLSLLSILPNGLSDAELVQSKLPISNILSCKAALLATSLAYQNSNKRLLALMPVREYVQQSLPPSPFLIHSLRKYFYALLELYRKYNGEQLHPVVSQITFNLANLQEVLQQGLYASDLNLADTIYCSISLNSFYRLTARGSVPLMDHIQHILPGTPDCRLKIHFLIEVLRSFGHYHHSSGLEELIAQGISHLKHVNDPLLEFCLIASIQAKFYLAASSFVYYMFDLSRALQFSDKACELSKLSGDSYEQCTVLIHIAWLKLSVGDYSTAQVYAREAKQLSEMSLDLYRSAVASRLQSVCYRYFGDYKESMAHIRRAKEILAICGMSGGYIDHLITLDRAEIHLLKSEYAQARSIFSGIAETTSSDQNAAAYATAFLNIAYIDIQIGGTVENVQKDLHRATEIFNNLSYHSDIVLCRAIQADMDLREHKIELAQVNLQECLHFRQGMYAETESFCLERLANIKAWPAIGWQSRWPIIYLSFAYKSREKLALHKALLFLGDIFIVNEDEDTAFTLYTVALEGFTYMDVHQSQAQCMLRLGDLTHKQGNNPVAIVHWKTARSLFEQSLQARDIAQIDSRLATFEKSSQRSSDETCNLAGTYHAV
ncbi:hypothetical protein K438DRAFT_1932541 [Mycena galopus ATCC 62051]|nr:hypothetical protein K438DRAFT_1932541 [Mycena galopus ATCC 62051]